MELQLFNGTLPWNFQAAVVIRSRIHLPLRKLQGSGRPLGGRFLPVATRLQNKKRAGTAPALELDMEVRLQTRTFTPARTKLILGLNVVSTPPPPAAATQVCFTSQLPVPQVATFEPLPLMKA